MTDILEHVHFVRNRDMLRGLCVAHVLDGEPVPSLGSRPRAGWQAPRRSSGPLERRAL